MVNRGRGAGGQRFVRSKWIEREVGSAPVFTKRFGLEEKRIRARSCPLQSKRFGGGERFVLRKKRNPR